MFSVVISIYKVEKYLRQCIESVLNQTYSDFELILVDDGSPDDCPRICDEYEKKDSRIKVIHKKNGGLMSTRKIGASVACGKYICFVDGDDFLQCDMLETYQKTLDKKDIDVICCGYSNYCDDETKNIEQKIPVGLYEKESLNVNVYPRMLSTEPFFSFFVMPSVCSKCFKTEIAKRVYVDIPDDISLGEDAAATYPMLLCADTIAVINYCGYMYRQNQNSMTHTYDKNLYKKVRNLIVHLRTVEKKLDWQSKNQIYEYTLYLLILAKNNEFKYNNSDTYSVKKKNMKRYLSDPIFKEALSRVKLSGARNKFIHFCLKKQFLMPIYIYESLAKRGVKNG